MNLKKQLLVIGFVWPEPNSSAAGARILDIINLFLNQNYAITFACAALESNFAFNLTSIGVSKVNIILNDSSFDVFINALNPSIVVFDRFMTEEQFGWRVSENCPNAMKILDTEDLHFLRHARALVNKQKRILETQDLFSDYAKREVASIYRCDLSLIISEFEMNLLISKFKVDKILLYYLPFLLDPINNVTVKNWDDFENRKHFIFVGNFLHKPNVNAVLFLKEFIWPHIKKILFDAELHIYGAYPPQAILQLHSPELGFNIIGRAISAVEVVKKAKVVLAPLQFGAGLKGKLVEAMFCGTPSVTTSIGAEAMHGKLPWNGSIQDDPHEFAKEAVILYQDRNLWYTAQKNGIKIHNTFYLKTKNGAKFIDRVLHIQKNLKQYRLKNFTGSMLMHHTLMSTKYMSKWIEEKSK